MTSLNRSTSSLLTTNSDVDRNHQPQSSVAYTGASRAFSPSRPPLKRSPASNSSQHAALAAAATVGNPRAESFKRREAQREKEYANEAGKPAWTLGYDGSLVAAQLSVSRESLPLAKDDRTPSRTSASQSRSALTRDDEAYSRTTTSSRSGFAKTGTGVDLTAMNVRQTSGPIVSKKTTGTECYGTKKDRRSPSASRNEVSSEAEPAVSAKALIKALEENAASTASEPLRTPQLRTRNSTLPIQAPTPIHAMNANIAALTAARLSNASAEASKWRADQRESDDGPSQKPKLPTRAEKTLGQQALSARPRPMSLRSGRNMTSVTGRGAEITQGTQHVMPLSFDNANASKDTVRSAEDLSVPQIVRSGSPMRLRDSPKPTKAPINTNSHEHLRRSVPIYANGGGGAETESDSPRRDLEGDIELRNLTSRKITAHMTGDSLADAIVASSLASSRAPSPSKGLAPPNPSRRHSKSHLFFHPQHREQSRTPSPSKGLRQTLRKPAKSEEDDGTEYGKRPKKGLVRKHPNKHHEGDRKRWRDSVTDRQKKRYEGVWAANRQPYNPSDIDSTSMSAMTTNYRLHSYAVRDIWSRSRLHNDVLEEVWNLIEPENISRYLQREQFIVGMWLIDQQLRGIKLPIRVSQSVWSSVKPAPRLRVPEHKS